MKFGPNLARCFLIIPNNLSPPGDFSSLVAMMVRVKMLGLGRVAGPGSHQKQVEPRNRMHSGRTFSCQFVSPSWKSPLPPWFTLSLLSPKWQVLYSPQAPVLTLGAFHAHKLLPLGWGYPWYLDLPLTSFFISPAQWKLCVKGCGKTKLPEHEEFHGPAKKQKIL